MFGFFLIFLVKSQRITAKLCKTAVFSRIFAYFFSTLITFTTLRSNKKKTFRSRKFLRWILFAFKLISCSNIVSFCAFWTVPLAFWRYHIAHTFKMKPFQLTIWRVTPDHFRDCIMWTLAYTIQFGVCYH